MTKLSFNSNNQRNNLLRVRLLSKLIVIFICFTLFVHRLIRALTSLDISTQTAKILTLTLPFLVALSVIVLVEYFLYRKLGLRILKCSKYFDLAFILVFTGEWMVTLTVSFNDRQSTSISYYIATRITTFSSFSWRTLLPILITQIWQLRIIPATAAFMYTFIYLSVNKMGLLPFVISAGILQVAYVIIIYYFDHKINFTMLIGNVQKDQWLQLNDFILNNIPENIAIMDSNGNPNFVSESLKKLMQRHHQCQDMKKFLQNIKQIHRIQHEKETEGDSDYGQEIQSLQRIASSESRNDFPEETNYDIQAVSSLEELIGVFGNRIRKGSIKEKSFQVFIGKFKHDDEQERSFEIKISFINQEPKKYILLILRDTTQRDLLLTLEGNIKYKDQLLASVSHELRTPLNGNINLIEAAIKSKDIPQKIKETLLTPAVRSSQFLLHLINDILDMSQIKAQKLRLIFQQANLRDTLNNTIQLLELHAKKKGLTLETSIDPKLPNLFCTDHVRLSQILLNLINNSIKFTQKGYVRLSAWPLKDTDYVNVNVEDTGIGMTQEETNRLFQDFTHIEFKDREKINPTGVGLGLKIANDLSKLLGPEDHKGISVTSELAKGSVFSFLIENKDIGQNSQDTRIEFKDEVSPLVANEFHREVGIDFESKITRNISTKSRISPGKIIPSTTSISSCNCSRVLVVDDDPFNILAYEAILNSLGVNYDSAYSGRSAIEKMLTKAKYPCSTVCCSYKVVFLDEQMPEMTGSETVAEIAALQRQNLLPSMTIIGCTAHHGGEALENFLKCGIAEYIPKPVSATTIQKILEKYNI